MNILRLRCKVHSVEYVEVEHVECQSMLSAKIKTKHLIPSSALSSFWRDFFGVFGCLTAIFDFESLREKRALRIDFQPRNRMFRALFLG